MLQHCFCVCWAPSERERVVAGEQVVVFPRTRLKLTVLPEPFHLHILILGVSASDSRLQKTLFDRLTALHCLLFVPVSLEAQPALQDEELQAFDADDG